MEYAGMTVNERLYVSDLLNDFDSAVARNDIDEVIKILKQVGLDEASIIPILESLGLK